MLQHSTVEHSNHTATTAYTNYLSPDKYINKSSNFRRAISPKRLRSRVFPERGFYFSRRTIECAWSHREFRVSLGDLPSLVKKIKSLARTILTEIRVTSRVLCYF